MSSPKSTIKEEPDDRALMKIASFIPTNKVIKLPQNKGGGVCIPMQSSELKHSIIRRAKSGGFLKLVNPSTGQEVIVPTLPYSTENETISVMDKLDGDDLTELELTMRRDADHSAVDKTRENSEDLKEEALSSYTLRKPVESLPKAAYLLLPSSYCVRYRNSLSFTSTATTISTINHDMLLKMKAPCLRLHHDPRIPPTISPLFAEPPAPEESAENTPIDKFEMIMNFTKEFRSKRLEFGFTQSEVIDSLYNMYGCKWSQTTISRFEGLILGIRHTCNIMSKLKRWLADIEAAIKREESLSSGGVIEGQEDDDKTFRMVSVACSGRDEPLTVQIKTDTDWVGRRRKRRKLWSEDKIEILERAFQREKMPGKETVTQLSSMIDEPYDIVRTWFCNRRAKHRRMNEVEVNHTSGILNIDASELTIMPESSENP